MSTYILHGGVNTIDGNIDKIEAHGGVLYVKGDVGLFVQHGGITYNQRSFELNSNNNEETAEDNVLVSRISHLRAELARQRQKYTKEIDELKERLEAALEINAKLRRRIPTIDTDKQDREIAERHIDILATLLSLYPYTATDDLVFEFGMPANVIRYIANVLGAVKSKQARQEAVEYLRKQDRTLNERRGGNQRKNKKQK